jgi:diguanylate cyclase (GGDEF)-like protein/PAS domain S-box-containing protein
MQGGTVPGVSRNKLAGSIALALACGFGTAANLAFSLAAPVPLWIVDGLLLGMVLTSPPAAAPLLLASALGGLVAGWAATGASLATGLTSAACSLLFVTTAAGALHALRWHVAEAATAAGSARLAAVVLLLAPLPGVAFLLAGIPVGQTATPSPGFLLTQALGVAVVLPMLIALRRRDLLLLFVPPLLTSTLVLLTLHSTVCLIVFVQDRYAVGFLVFPTLLLIVSRLGTPGAGLGMMLTGVVAIGSLLGTGPSAGLPAGSLQDDRLFLLLVHLFVLSAVAYPMGVAVVERRRMNQALADQHARLGRNESLYRLLAHHASDVISRVRLDGRRVYVSPSVLDVLGWTVAEAMRPDWQDNIHPDDLAGFTAARTRLSGGSDEAHTTYRFRRKDGAWAWIEARMHLVRAADGSPKEFVANSRNISRQKEAEQALEAALAELAELAATDALTGVANRRSFDAAFDQEWRRAMRSAEPTSLLLIDADHFKTYNDRYGHQAGDDCLRSIARTIADNLRRPHDLVARYGGEEFVAILPVTDEDGALRVADSIRRAVEEIGLPHEGNATGVVTISVGVATMVPTGAIPMQDLVEAADVALYAAKHNGRNRVEAAKPVPDDSIVVPLLPHLRRHAT